MLPIDAIKREPEVAFEQFRHSIGHLRQIMAVGDAAKVRQLFEVPGRATDDERAVWKLLDRSWVLTQEHHSKNQGDSEQKED